MNSIEFGCEMGHYTGPYKLFFIAVKMFNTLSYLTLFPNSSLEFQLDLIISQLPQSETLIVSKKYLGLWTSIYGICSIAIALDSDINQTAGSGCHLSM